MKKRRNIFANKTKWVSGQTIYLFSQQFTAVSLSKPKFIFDFCGKMDGCLFFLHMILMIFCIRWTEIILIQHTIISRICFNNFETSKKKEQRIKLSFQIIEKKTNIRFYSHRTNTNNIIKYFIILIIRWIAQLSFWTHIPFHICLICINKYTSNNIWMDLIIESSNGIFNR